MFDEQEKAGLETEKLARRELKRKKLAGAKRREIRVQEVVVPNFESLSTDYADVM